MFHHASFPDFLLDRSRSLGYFVNVEIFNFNIISAVWKSIGEDYDLEGRCAYAYVFSHAIDHHLSNFIVEAIAFSGLYRLRTFPPDFLDTLRALRPQDFHKLGNVQVIKDAFKLIYNLVRQFVF